MKLSFKIALRFLKSSKGQTLLIALGIAIGVSVQIFIGTLIQGLQKSLVDRTIGNQPQITLAAAEKDTRIEKSDELMASITKDRPEITAIAAAADGPALIHEGEDTYSVLVRGLDLASSDKIYGILDKIVEGSAPTADNEVLIGKDLSVESGISVGDELEVQANVMETKTLTVTGIFDLGVASINKSWAITTLPTAQGLFDYGDQVTGIELQVKDVFAADTLASTIQQTVGTEFTVDNWKDQNAQLLSGLSGQSVSSIMIQVFVMISVLLGIASILAITVVQKSKQIGILKAMGIRDKTSSLIFLFEGLLLGIVGAVLGILLGLGLAWSFATFALNPDGTPVVPLYLDRNFILLSAGVAVVAATIAALIPARNSSRLNPIEVIRNA
ncbi:ABC transporter permease [Proteiniclasticum sp. BAD-10]|uniref:ABC transporter permease n=1 Tax=Proteiniclasticum sediminis TaxID=2804028 RepID=A0A941CS53_9CLOT|nr:FtsX-like permease family protein [Proteiniclasticum sediminis]MBR0576366.1 ABC transporter permease [Proteiniclasticum sediminis]